MLRLLSTAAAAMVAEQEEASKISAAINRSIPGGRKHGKAYGVKAAKAADACPPVAVIHPTGIVQPWFQFHDFWIFGQT